MSASDAFLDIVKIEVACYLESFPEDADHLSLLREQISKREDVLTRKNFTGHVTAGAIVLLGDTGRTVIVANKSLGFWVFPGGHCEPGERPSQSAARELEEETGITGVMLHPWHLQTGAPLEINSHAIPPSERKGEPAHMHHDFRYLFTGPSDVDVSVDPDEINGIRVLPLEEALEVRGMGKAASRIQFIVSDHWTPAPLKPGQSNSV